MTFAEKHKDEDEDQDKDKDKDKDKNKEWKRPNMCYICEKQRIQGYQTWPFHQDDKDKDKYKEWKRPNKCHTFILKAEDARI